MEYQPVSRQDYRASIWPGRRQNNRKVTLGRKLQLHRNYSGDQVSGAKTSVERARRLRSLRNLRCK